MASESCVMWVRRVLALVTASLLVALSVGGSDPEMTGRGSGSALQPSFVHGGPSTPRRSGPVQGEASGPAEVAAMARVSTEPSRVGGNALGGGQPAAGGPNPCPQGMVRVSGQYCTEVRHTCADWLDDPKLQYARCGEYEPPASCVGKRISMGFCIDRYEYTAPGQRLPSNYQSYMTASRTCRKLGKRICTEHEWNFACEGEQMLPYPYGWKREPKCNQDRTDLHEIRVGPGRRKQVLRDLRAPADSHPECVSPFGVYNMVGNLDEPVLREVARFNPPFRNGLKGGWWMAGRNRCRPATTAHDDYYRDIQVGIRCCADLPGAVGASG
jgi:sulfatase modifying factor 1